MNEIDYDEADDDGEWQTGECDRCEMEPGETIGWIGACCACSIGQGAPQADCDCPWGSA